MPHIYYVNVFVFVCFKHWLCLFCHYRVPSVTSNGAESGTEEDEEMAAEEDESEGEEDLPLEMVDDAGRSNKVEFL